ncbi:MAG: hypothetical protein H6807_00850 [Planctomycetes bacterium]|nr:hypothetical protein [Planctomycetota bacterium]
MRLRNLLLLVVVLALAPALSAQEHGAGAGAGSPQIAPAPIGMPGWEVTSSPPLPIKETLSRSGQFYFDHLKQLTPGQTTALWLGLVTMLVLAFDWSRWLRPRNLVLVLLYGPALLFFDLDAQSTQFADPVAWSRFRLITTGIFGMQVLSLGWALFARLRGGSGQSFLPLRALRVLALLFLGLTLASSIVGEGADSSIYTNFGTQRMRERGKLPYGDPWLARGTACSYGPAIYLMILPAQLILDREPLNEAVDLPTTYERSRGMPVRLTVAALLLVTFVATVMLGATLGSREVGWTLAALVFSSPFTLGIGSDHSTLVGAMNISDTAPIAFVMLALLWLGRRPLLAGLALGQATACGFFPILMLPAIVVWLKSRGQGLMAFLAAFALIGLAYLALVWFGTETRGEENPAQVFLDCTFGVQERPNDPAGMRVGYGDSPFGFWGSHPRSRDLILGRPGSGENKPWKWLFLGLLVLMTSIRARRADPRLLIASCGALALGVQLVRLHAAGVHVMWYQPLLLAALLAIPSRVEAPGAGGEGEGSEALEARA